MKLRSVFGVALLVLSACGDEPPPPQAPNASRRAPPEAPTQTRSDLPLLSFSADEAKVAYATDAVGRPG